MKRVIAALVLALAMVPVMGGVASAGPVDTVNCVVEHYKQGEDFWMPCFYPEP